MDGGSEGSLNEEDIVRLRLLKKCRQMHMKSTRGNWMRRSRRCCSSQRSLMMLLELLNLRRWIARAWWRCLRETGSDSLSKTGTLKITLLNLERSLKRYWRDLWLILNVDSKLLKIISIKSATRNTGQFFSWDSIKLDLNRQSLVRLPSSQSFSLI